MKRLSFIFIIVTVFLVACKRERGGYSIIPYPNSLIPASGVYSIDNTVFFCDSRLDSISRVAVGNFAAELSRVSGISGNVDYASAPASDEGFRFFWDESLGSERYKLEVNRRGVEVRASAFPGLFYALQTIRQLLPVRIYGRVPAPDADWSLPCVSIDDAPRFGYRGMHLDVARHFFSVEEVKRYLDVMAMHKLNRFHWHLTDDQGWRIEIKRYPELTTVGSIRKATVIRKEWGHYDDIPYGGYYTQDEIREVVRYAAERAITVIPEIDLPGHMLAALTAYPQLGCTGGPYEVWGRWGVADDVLCAGNENIYEFLENVLSEVMDLFPSEYIHIGGDECPKVRWEKCPRCQAKIAELGLKSDGKHSAEHYLQSYVMSRISKFLSEHGRRVIGWDEMLEGELAPGATVMSWRGSEGGIEAAKLGHDAIMTPTSHFYFDYYQARDIENEPFGIGGYVPIEKVYAYEPIPDTLSLALNDRILGVQANMWTEYILSDKHLEYMLLPRLAALSEVQWCNPERREWSRFAGALPHLVDIYDEMGYNYSRTIFGVQCEVKNIPAKGCVEARLSTLGNAPIRYTLDGSNPVNKGCLYTAPIEIRDTCTLKAVALHKGRQSRIFEQVFSENKAMGHAVELNTAPLGKYTFGAPESLVNGLESNFSYANGDWVGWFGSPMLVTIDMAGQKYGSVRLGTLVSKGEDIFPPLALVVSTSDSGERFTEIARLEIPMETKADPDGLKSYSVSFPETSARYLRVEAQAVNPIPDWHGTRGSKGFLFVDEICVK